ncbi:MAG: ABC transporter ATP-binding protein [Ezakiella sp.]
MKVLETNGLSMNYGTKKALSDVSVSVNAGEIYGLVGKNGAGKTTLMKIVLGLLPGYSGELKLFESENLGDGRKNIGALIETPVFFENMTGYQNLKYYRMAYGLDSSIDLEELLRDVKLADARDKKFKAYSLGMKQRLGIAFSLLGNPDFLVLDEPINGIDPEGIVEIRNLLKDLANKGKTILISSHILSELEHLCDRICIIENGEVVDVIESKKDKKLRYHTVIKTSDDKKFKKILDDFKIEISKDGVIVGDFDIDKVLKKVYENGLSIVEIERRKDNLEEYYLGRLEGRNK